MLRSFTTELFPCCFYSNGLITSSASRVWGDTEGGRPPSNSTTLYVLVSARCESVDTPRPPLCFRAGVWRRAGTSHPANRGDPTSHRHHRHEIPIRIPQPVSCPPPPSLFLRGNAVISMKQIRLLAFPLTAVLKSRHCRMPFPAGGGLSD